jgi:hypothetical protein
LIWSITFFTIFILNVSEVLIASAMITERSLMFQEHLSPVVLPNYQVVIIDLIVQVWSTTASKRSDLNAIRLIDLEYQTSLKHFLTSSTVVLDTKRLITL